MRLRSGSADRASFRIACASLALLAVIGLSFADFTDRQTSVAPPQTDAPVLESIQSVYRPLRQADRSGEPLGRAYTVSPESIFEGQASFLRSEDYAVYEAWSLPAASTLPAAKSDRQPGAPAAARQAAKHSPERADGGLSGAAALLFESSFSSLFANVFAGSRSERIDHLMAGLDEEDRNPFSEARLQDRVEAAENRIEGKAEKAARETQSAETTPAPAAQPAKQDAAPAAARVAAQAERVLVLGDFDGSGVLAFAEARRLGDGVFQFPDATRTFNLYMNPSAVDVQRSFTVEDINGDGLTDLLVTSRSSMFGGVLHGDGKGEYRLVNTFLTGYEPTIAATGPVRDGGREIITVNTRSGSTGAFRPQPRYFLYRASFLDFTADYIGRVVETGTGLDYLMAGRAGSQPRLYSMLPDSRLESAGELPQQEAGHGAARPLQIQTDAGTTLVYQVGARASVIIQNRAGQAFNVANLLVSPEIFLIVGDLHREGTLDVAVAHLLATTAK